MMAASSVTMPADSTMGERRNSRGRAREDKRSKRRQLKRRLKAKAKAKLASLRRTSVGSDVSDHESDLDLDKPLSAIPGYVNHPELMLEHMFRSISRHKLKAMLPDILKFIPLGELRNLCLEQVEMMSRKRISRILDGDDPDNISSSGTEEESSSEDEEDRASVHEKDWDDREEGLADSTSQHRPITPPVHSAAADRVESASPSHSETSDNGDSGVKPHTIAGVRVKPEPDLLIQPEVDRPAPPKQQQPPAERLTDDAAAASPEEPQAAAAGDDVPDVVKVEKNHPKTLACPIADSPASPIVIAPIDSPADDDIADACQHIADGAAEKQDERAQTDGALQDKAQDARDKEGIAEGRRDIVEKEAEEEKKREEEKEKDDEKQQQEEKEQDDEKEEESDVDEEDDHDDDHDDPDLEEGELSDSENEGLVIDADSSGFLDSDVVVAVPAKTADSKKTKTKTTKTKKLPDSRQVQLKDTSSAPRGIKKERGADDVVELDDDDEEEDGVFNLDPLHDKAAGGKKKKTAAAAAGKDVGVYVSKNQMEILELEMRARAIKAMLKVHEEIDERERDLKQQEQRLLVREQKLQGDSSTSSSKRPAGAGAATSKGTISKAAAVLGSKDYGQLTKAQKAQLLAARARQQADKARQMKALIAQRQAEKMKLNAAVQRSLRRQAKDKDCAVTEAKRIKLRKGAERGKAGTATTTSSSGTQHVAGDAAGDVRVVEATGGRGGRGQDAAQGQRSQEGRAPTRRIKLKR